MKDNNVAYLQTAKTDVYSSFEELRSLIQEKLLDIVYERVEKAIPTSKRKEEIEEVLESLLPEEKRYLVSELSDLAIGRETERIKEAVFYVFGNTEEIKRTIMGF